MDNLHVFRTNSIRGVYGRDIDETLFEKVGRALAAFVPQGAAVAADHRLSSPALKEALLSGLAAAGRRAHDAGTAGKGQAIFAAGRLGLPLAYISASHLPPEWNGIKFIHPDGLTWSAAENVRVREAFLAGPGKAPGGSREERDWRQECLDFLADRLPRPESPLSVLADCGNGTGAILGPELLSELGFMVAPLFEELDGRMPNRPSELTPEALRKAGRAMTGHDLGLAWDGDADRIAFVAPSGRPIDPERFAFVILRELTKTDPGGIVANVSCGATIERLAARFGRQLWRTPTGTPHLIGRLVAEKAAFGMEASGHLVIRSVLPYDDAVAVGAYAAWALSAAQRDGLTLDGLLAEVPEQPRRRVVFEVADGAKAGLMERLDARLTREFGDGAIERMDGLRVKLPEGWALVRASNTEPGLRLFAEASSPAALDDILGRFGAMVREEEAADSGPRDS